MLSQFICSKYESSRGQTAVSYNNRQSVVLTVLYLVGRWFKDWTSNNEADMAAWLPQNQSHLLRAHPSDIDITNLQDMVPTTQVAFLQLTVQVLG